MDSSIKTGTTGYAVSQKFATDDHDEIVVALEQAISVVKHAKTYRIRVTAIVVGASRSGWSHRSRRIRTLTSPSPKKPRLRSGSSSHNKPGGATLPLDDPRFRVGVHYAAMALQSVVQTAHDGTATGFAWFHVPIASTTTKARLRGLDIGLSMLTEADHLSTPRIVLARFTYTGTAAGAAVTPGKRRTEDTAAVGSLRTAVTGLTVTVGAAMWSCVVPAWAVTTSGTTWSATPVYGFTMQDENDYVDVSAGEGLLLYQPDTGTATDGRRFTCNWRWQEIAA